MVVPVGDPLSLSVWRGSRVPGHVGGGQSLCVSLTLASCRTFYSAKGAGEPFKVLMAHSPKMTPPPSLSLSLLRPSSRRFYSFRLQSSFLQCLSCLARARITAVAAAPSLPPSALRYFALRRLGLLSEVTEGGSEAAAVRGFTEVRQVWKVGEKLAIPSSILSPQGERRQSVAVGAKKVVSLSNSFPTLFARSFGKADFLSFFHGLCGWFAIEICR